MKKYIFYVAKMVEGHIKNKNIPLFVILCVTNRCNLRCIYCYAEYYEREHSEFTTKEILDLIDELASMGTKYISINGGEALLRSDIETIVDKIKEKNMLCHISTNGLLIKKNISAVKKADSIAISIDGRKESNDINRGAGVYDKIIETFGYLNENHIKFQTHTVLTKNNKNAVEEIMYLASQYNFKAQFSPLRIEDSSAKNINLTDEELKEITRKILEYKKSGYPIFFSSEPYENLLNWPFSYDKQFICNEAVDGYKAIKCFVKRFSCHIEANGFVYPCIVLVNKFKALNFLDVGFRKAWKNLDNNDCKACYNVCCNDLNLVFGFKPRSVLNAVKIAIGRSFRENL